MMKMSMIKRSILVAMALFICSAGMTAMAQDDFQGYDDEAEDVKKGYTWTKTGTDDIHGVIDVGCGWIPGLGNICNPYDGDTVCSAELPVLCFYDAGLDRPADLPPSNQYHTWSGGIVATTDRKKGSSFGSIEEADAFCEETFGRGWRVAEHHDGWGWYLKAYGNVGDNFDHHQNRYWVHVDDQPNGTCW